eukprot:2400236-Amphidinium_carterae.1
MRGLARRGRNVRAQGSEQFSHLRVPTASHWWWLEGVQAASLSARAQSSDASSLNSGQHVVRYGAIRTGTTCGWKSQLVKAKAKSIPNVSTSIAEY